MKKNDLIDLLNRIKGNPDILLWNGYAGDYQTFYRTPKKIELVKHCKGHLMTRLEVAVHRGEILADEIPQELARISRAETWELPNVFLDEVQYKEWYGDRRKTVYVFEAKPRGKRSYHRAGNLDY
jgi:hypothetical protein